MLKRVLVHTHSPEEGHDQAGEMHGLGEDDLRITERYGRKGTLRSFPLKLSFYRWGSRVPEKGSPQHHLEIEHKQDIQIFLSHSFRYVSV